MQVLLASPKLDMMGDTFWFTGSFLTLPRKHSVYHSVEQMFPIWQVYCPYGCLDSTCGVGQLDNWSCQNVCFICFFVSSFLSLGLYIYSVCSPLYSKWPHFTNTHTYIQSSYLQVINTIQGGNKVQCHRSVQLPELKTAYSPLPDKQRAYPCCFWSTLQFCLLRWELNLQFPPQDSRFQAKFQWRAELHLTLERSLCRRISSAQACFSSILSADSHIQSGLFTDCLYLLG